MRKRSIAARLSTVVIACAAACVTPAFAGSYGFERLGVNRIPYAINDAGQIAGDLFDSGAMQVFVLSHGLYTAFNVPDPSASQVHLVALNAKGLVVGRYFSSSSGPAGFTYDIATGQQTRLSVVNSSRVAPEAINRSATIAGDGVDGKIFIINGTVARLIGKTISEDFLASSITNSGIIAGVYGPEHSGTEGFTLRKGVYATVSPPGATRVLSMGINNAGVVFGTYLAGTAQHGFTEINGAFTTFDFPGAVTTSIVGVSMGGLVIGNFEPSGSTAGGFVWNHGSYIPIRVPGALDTSITGINGNGEMVGVYDSQSNRVFGFLARCAAAQAPCTQ